MQALRPFTFVQSGAMNARHCLPFALLLCPACATVDPSAPQTSLFAERWPAKGGPQEDRFVPKAHKPNYAIARLSSNPNQKLFDEEAAVTGLDAPDLQAAEIKFQLSLKTKVMDDVGEGGSLWLAYTQQSNWQAFNFSESAPFRDTNYEPELIWNVPLDGEVLDWKLRFVNLGFVHQSNGRSEPLSRSWNRFYAQFGAENGPFALLVRPWWRVPEGDDNNPEIERFYGYGDLVALWKQETCHWALTLRNNLRLDGNKGAAQLDWVYPLSNGARVYVQAFSGYGESLMDYDRATTTLGIGFQMSDWL